MQMFAFISMTFYMSTIEDIFSSTIRHWEYSGESSFQTENVTGLQYCVSLCKAHGKCWSVDYNRKTLTCVMHKSDEVNVTSVTMTSDWSLAIIKQEEKVCGNIQCSDCETCVKLKSGSDKCIFVDPGSKYIGHMANIMFSSIWFPYNDSSLNSTLAWAPLTQNGSYIQFDFNDKHTIHGVTTKGLYASSHNVTLYSIQYTDPVSSTWKIMHDEIGIEMNFAGNSASDVAVTNLFTAVVETKAIRLLPLSWNVHTCLRMDIIGCKS